MFHFKRELALLPGLAIGGLAVGGIDALQNIGGGLVRDTAEGLTEGIVNAIFDTLLGGDS